MKSNLKKIKSVLAFITSIMLTATVAVGCSNSSEENIVIPDDYTKTTIDEAVGVNFFGTSVEFDPHFFSQNKQKRLVEDKDWEIVESRVEKMGISRFRVMVLPSWIEPLNDDNNENNINWDNLTKNSAEMQSLCKVLDLAEKNNIDVNLTLWGTENNLSLIDVEMDQRVKGQGGHFLAKNNQSKNWVMGTLYPEEFAENFSIYIQYLKNEKNYTCIKEITPCNEPDWSYQINSKVNFEDYATLCKAIDARFKADGIREQVSFTLSDNCDANYTWMQNTVEQLDEIADVYTSHTYMFGYTTSNSAITNWCSNFMNLVRNTKKPYIVGEFGSNQNVGSSRQNDIDEYSRGVLIAREMLNFYNAGAGGASYWVLFDQYYNYTDQYASMMKLGLWKSSKRTYTEEPEYYREIKEDFEVRPQYYAFSLISKHVPKGAEVYPISNINDFTVGTAFKGTDGKWTYVFANGGDKTEKVAYTDRNVGNISLQRYVYEEGKLPQGDDLISSDLTVNVKNGTFIFEIPSMSVMLFKQK